MSQTTSTDDSTDLNDKLGAAGRPTIRDKRDGVSEDDVVAYGCPFCDYEAPHERFVRAHITQTQSGRHKHRNGYLEQIFVHALDEDGNTLLDVRTEYDDANADGEITTQMFDDDVTEKQQQILDVVVRNPGLSNIAAAERIAERYDYEPSDGYVSKVRKQYLNEPDQERSGKGKRTSQKSYDDLTDIQRAIVDEVMEFDDPVDPDTWPVSQTEVANRADTHMTNIRPTLEKYETLILHRKAKRDARSEQSSRPVEADHSQAEPTPTPTVAPERAPESDATPTVRVEKTALKQFAQELDTLKRTTNNQHDASPRDSPMRAHAEGKLELIERCERFLKDVAACQSGGETDE